MVCPYCGETFSLWSAIKFWFWLKLPFSFHMYLEKRKEKKDLKKLTRIYYSMIKLTDREKFVCHNRIAGLSFEEVSNQMNVTRERVRQIQAKAFRKLRGKK